MISSSWILFTVEFFVQLSIIIAFIFLGDHLWNGSSYAIRPLSVCLSVTLVYCGQMVGRIKMKLGMQVGPWPHCVRWGPSSPPPKYRAPIFGPYLLWPNGWLDQDATWYWGRTRPRRLYVRWGPSSPPQKGDKGHGAPSPIFGPCPLWSNGWMDQDGTWHRDGPWSRLHCARLGPNSFPQKGGRAPSQFLAHFCCGQMAGCIKMTLGMEVGLSPGEFVLDRDPAPCQKGGRAPPQF